MNEVPSYAWPGAIALVVLALIQAFKSERIPINIPPRARPWVAVALGVLGGAATAVAAGRPLLEALVLGITGGTGSIGLFELGSNAAAKPAKKSDDDKGDPPTSSAPPGSVVLGGIMFALVAFGCSGLPPELVEALERSDAPARLAYAAALEACPDVACDDKVKTAFAAARLVGDREAWEAIDREHDAKRAEESGR